eukprot:m.8771 g.8771  ORF g.8771 m.8771 type:complete len:381 (-) comp2329_c0_seq1:303-1445(-)
MSSASKGGGREKEPKDKRSKAQKRKDKASAAVEVAWHMFDQYYTSVYGERWPALKAACMRPISHCALWNMFASGRECDQFCAALRADLQAKNAVQLAIDKHLECFFLPPVEDGHNFPHPPRCIESGRVCYYPMDAASLLPVKALAVEEGDDVLDMCAAPGGKSLALAMSLALWPRAAGRLECNDVSTDRRRRLRQVLESYLPESTMAEAIHVTGHDCTAWRRGADTQYDKILLDAPCSTERHLMLKADEIAEWSMNRPRQSARRQIKLLLAGLRSLRTGGRLVYSTCSLSPLENDDVVSKALRKMHGGASIVPPPPMPFGEPTTRGWIVLPDNNAAGWGPLYFAILVRNEQEEKAGAKGSDDEDDAPDAAGDDAADDDDS